MGGRNPSSVGAEMTKFGEEELKLRLEVF